MRNSLQWWKVISSSEDLLKFFQGKQISNKFVFQDSSAERKRRAEQALAEKIEKARIQEEEKAKEVKLAHKSAEKISKDLAKLREEMKKRYKLMKKQGKVWDIRWKF